MAVFSLADKGFDSMSATKFSSLAISQPPPRAAALLNGPLSSRFRAAVRSIVAATPGRETDGEGGLYRADMGTAAYTLLLFSRV